MSYSKRSRYSRSPSPYKRYGKSRSVSRSLSRSMSRSCSRSRDSSEVENPGNNLYVTGLSPRITKRELEKHFSGEGTVVDVHLVVDPWTRESRGFGFVTMSNIEEADRCIKYLDRSVLEGRVITVEKARRRRGRTPTPGKYLGLRTVHVRRRSPSYSPYRRSHSSRYSSERDRSRSYSPYYGHRSYTSRRRSPSRSLSPYSRSPVSRHDRYYSPYGRRDRSYSPYGRRDRSYSPYGRRDRSYSPYNSRYYSPVERYYRRRRYRSISRSISPIARRSSRRNYSRSVSPRTRRNSRRSYSRSISPRPWMSSRRSYSRSSSPRPRRSSRRSVSRGASSRRGDSRHSYDDSRSHSASASCRSVSRSPTPRSCTPRSASPSS